MRLTRILFKGKSLWPLSVAWIGWAIGLAMLLSGIQFMRNFQITINQEADLIGPEFVTLQKKITLLNTFLRDQSGFEVDEIRNLQEIKGVQQVASFMPNRYSAQLFVSKGSKGDIPYFYTDVFFEALPAEVIDLDPVDWRWSPGQEVVPILLPRDFLHLYNFGFAPGQNLPRLSEATIGMINFGIRIRGNGKTGEYRGRVAGFSSRINSILVPVNFLEITNAVFSEEPPALPQRLVVKIENVASTGFKDFIDRQGYEVSGSGFKTGKLHGLLTLVLNAVISIAALILVLCFINLLQTILLLIARSEYEIRTLLLIGYKPFNVIGVLMSGKAIILVSSTLAAFVLASVVNKKIQYTMSSQGGIWTAGLESGVVAIGFALMSIMLIVDFVVLRRTVNRFVR